MVFFRFLANSIKGILTPPTVIETLLQTNSFIKIITNPKPVRIPRSEHTLSRQNISKSALKVLYQLKEAGYQAFLVGGGVRDVLLGRSPKDFDVVTNAHPEQIKSVFLRHCHLIGRRFPLAHVRFGKEIVEVATFRALHEGEGKGIIMQDGRIVRDNAYGSTVDEDALRRDFTINALYYDISDFSVIDYADGIADLRAGIVRLIGDPLMRYREDSVRMLRAIRFAAKLGFKIDPATANPIYELGNLLVEVHSARLYEEVLKLFLTGHSAQSFAQLRHYALFKQLFPQTENCFSDPVALALIEQALYNADERFVNKQPIVPEFLFATLLWPPLLKMSLEYQAQYPSEQEGFLAASQYVLRKQAKRVSIPRRVAILIEEIWLLQFRLAQRRTKRRSLSIMRNARFRAGYDFLLLRAAAGEPVSDSANWWTQFLAADEKTQQKLLAACGQQEYIRRPRRRRKPKKEID